MYTALPPAAFSLIVGTPVTPGGTNRSVPSSALYGISVEDSFFLYFPFAVLGLIDALFGLHSMPGFF